MSTIFNGKIIPEADARRMVARAQDYGWLPPYMDTPTLFGRTDEVRITDHFTAPPNDAIKQT